MLSSRTVFALTFGAVLSLSAPALLGCGGAAEPKVGSRDALADKWLQRARASYQTGDLEDANQAIEQALSAAPNDAEVKLLAGHIALSQLDFARVLQVTEGVQQSEAHMLRGRAYWYSGELARAAGELDAMLKDPEAKDPWAQSALKLARSGHGRKPFQFEGAVVSAVEMPQSGALVVVPCELDGENILAVLSTGVAELMIDSATRKEPAWVSLRFGDLEVKDVPAVPMDLQSLSQQLGAPVKALLGVHLLRRLNATFDRGGSQFVVRQHEPSAPPDASRVPLRYVRGGGMMLAAHLASKGEAQSFLVDTSQPYPLSLSDDAWRAAGIAPANLKRDAQLPGDLRAGKIPYFRIGGFELPEVPAVQGAPLDEMRARVGLDFAGVVGSGLLAAFRVTIGGQGRHMWLEELPMISLGDEPAAPSGANAPQSQGKAP